tara:strand:+ start:80013 stop:80306 length:294 start_codon:yes stop_codon:yes gene_type:complete
MKPYFLPLMKIYYLKFKSGEQDCEIRPANHHGWNIKNIFPGRSLLLSSGYGKQDRLVKEIRSTMITHDLNQEKIPIWHIDAVESIYGKRDKWLVAYV